MFCPQEWKDQGKCNKGSQTSSGQFIPQNVQLLQWTGKDTTTPSVQMNMLPHCNHVIFHFVTQRHTHHDILMQVHQMCKNLHILTLQKSEFLVLNIQLPDIYFMRMTPQCWAVPWTARLTQQWPRSDPESVKHQLWFIKWHCGKFLSEYFSFSISLSCQQCSILIPSSTAIPLLPMHL
jgi:hypothetical protein